MRTEEQINETNGTPDRNETAINRRAFLASTALVGGCAALTQMSGCSPARVFASPPGPYDLGKPENVLYSTCLQCHVACPMKAKIWDGTLAKITGNPYSPLNYLPHLPLDTPLDRAALTDGKLCAKGQAGIQTYYDPYRIRRVLKRSGPRGSDKWRSIEFNQFIDEVTGGGRLFAEIGDESHYPGFSEVYALRDPAVAKAMAADAKLVGKGEMTVAAFKTKHAAHLDTLIDPDHPDLGPKNNGFIFDAGRIEHGRKELMKWFTNDCFGSPNVFEHTTICEQSHHIAYDEMSGGATHHLKPDLPNAQFVIFWGTGAFTANFGLTPMAEKVTRSKLERGMKTAVIDPRLSNDAAKADWWLPVKPGGDGALALAMVRWILENDRYDARYLANANRAAAVEDGEPTFTNSTHLVKVVDGRGVALLRAEEAGVGSSGKLVVSQGDRLVAIDPEDKQSAIEGDLFVSTTVNGMTVKSGLQLLREEALSHSWDEYVDASGIPYEQIAEVARELTSHGKRAGVEMYRGPVQHTDGYYAGCAIICLNLLIGNLDFKGGMSRGGSHWHEFGGKDGNIYHYKKMHPAKLATFGPKITREKSKYEDFTLFRENGYPARRPWYPFSSNIYQEVIPSMAMGYPYRGQILFLHKGTPCLASPAGNTNIDMVRDQRKVPLFIACDIVIGETSMYADYIVPDLTYLERWGTPHVTPDIPVLTSKIRQPVAAPLVEECDVDGERMPICLEAFLIAVGKKLGLRGIGVDAFGAGMSFDRPEDWYMKLVANIAAGDKKGDVVPEASDEEMELFRTARRHLPKSVFDEEKWKRAVGPNEWRRCVYLLNRGGRFAPAETSYDGPYMKKKLGKMFQVFVEKVARQKNSLSGEPFSGIPIYRGQIDAAGRPLARDRRFPFTIITYKEPFGGHSRTISNYWTNVAMMPENRIIINHRDADKHGFEPGQRVRVTSAANPTGTVDLGNGRVIDVAGRLQLCEGIRPGVVAVSWHYGHWAYGSNDVEVDQQTIRGDPRRGTGLCPNLVMAVDPDLKDVGLTDPIGASASFYDTMVRLEPV
ncbi:MAG: molybdopterin-dependent oxidoreductase [Planctomycetota bacterium]|jgi:anaerobic selenocysteine-containing dehydrogenase